MIGSIEKESSSTSFDDASAAKSCPEVLIMFSRKIKASLDKADGEFTGTVANSSGI